ncbi:hypothetical protein HBI56_026730 [Parastagonospora nodorum]|uniref:Uncharacterized protein n=1 Tax=Phaeosphaeria nodorum (strain SN15 / ATCC MYA-4574 / FGSC 10173) TaxID=321614 RepID=A0A7U2EXS9_PHANO|nr:hypothetical protein HBH56_014380 [Parastagonospora nodorum]QRC94937.1 hypothetical protein JI435_431570 [Parastagonospora nodorum SN15]KAH4015273.1 hypothetical protein HBI13_160770 [Parastagonospora nodorum]KAH4100712.1 hypothetical protein HBH46_150210 [Parastagonospora nodorum]KAH4120721.1 hypothetical protein HBH47_105280 [Parastagonospora nodorum]
MGASLTASVTVSGSFSSSAVAFLPFFFLAFFGVDSTTASSAAGSRGMGGSTASLLALSVGTSVFSAFETVRDKDSSTVGTVVASGISSSMGGCATSSLLFSTATGSEGASNCTEGSSVVGVLGSVMSVDLAFLAFFFLDFFEASSAPSASTAGSMVVSTVGSTVGSMCGPTVGSTVGSGADETAVSCTGFSTADGAALRCSAC